MKNGMDLEATLLRRGLPFDVTAETRLAADWFQVSQRVSQSENGLARWEVVGAAPTRAPGQARHRGVRPPVRCGRGIPGISGL